MQAQAEIARQCPNLYSKSRSALPPKDPNDDEEDDEGEEDEPDEDEEPAVIREPDEC